MAYASLFCSNRPFIVALQAYSQSLFSSDDILRALYFSKLAPKKGDVELSHNTLTHQQRARQIPFEQDEFLSRHFSP